MVGTSNCSSIQSIFTLPCVHFIIILGSIWNQLLCYFCLCRCERLAHYSEVKCKKRKQELVKWFYLQFTFYYVKFSVSLLFTFISQYISLILGNLGKVTTIAFKTSCCVRYCITVINVSTHCNRYPNYNLLLMWTFFTLKTFQINVKYS